MIVGDNFTSVPPVTRKSQRYRCKNCEQIFYCVNLEKVKKLN